MTGPLGDPVDAEWGVRGDTAVIEMARASGLALVAENDPLVATTFGTGELFGHARRGRPARDRGGRRLGDRRRRARRARGARLRPPRNGRRRRLRRLDDLRRRGAHLRPAERRRRRGGAGARAAAGTPPTATGASRGSTSATCPAPVPPEASLAASQRPVEARDRARRSSRTGRPALRARERVARPHRRGPPRRHVVRGKIVGHVTREARELGVPAGIVAGDAGPGIPEGISA